LATFLSGGTSLSGRITLVEDIDDEELHAACRLIDSRLPDPDEHLGFGSGGPDHHGARRTSLLQLAQHLEPLPRLSQVDLDRAEASLLGSGRHLQRPSSAPQELQIVSRAISFHENQ
jgi:hypothetical protein